MAAPMTAITATMEGTDAMALTGRCMCGAVTITAEPAREALTVCHCDMCRQWTSSMFMALETKEGSVEIEGPVRLFQSSDWAERAFCEVCGSNLWYRITAEGPGHGQYQLAAGLFETGDRPVGLEVFIDRKPAGYALEGEPKQMTEAEILAYFAPET